MDVSVAAGSGGNQTNYVIVTCNGSEGNTTNCTGDDDTIPSRYSTLHVTIACVVVGIIILEIILGNILVIVAIVKDKNLKTRQNWLIASLSVADLCVGCLIMPLTLAYELVGYWPFGGVLCDIWLIIDVLLCTASVMNLCVISLDRYWCVTRPLTYPQKRTPKRMAIMIACSWGLSAVICMPPAFGWKTEQPEQKYPQCMLSQELGYILYSISGSFFVPLIVTCAVYAKVLHVARSRARRNLSTNKKKEQFSVNPQQTTVVMVTKEASSSSSDGASEKGGKEQDKNGNTNCATAEVTYKPNPAVKIQENESSDSATTHSTSNVTKRRFLCCARDQHEDKRGARTSLVPSQFDAQKMKRKIAKARERRATLTVGLIVFSFALCWLPFGISYIVDVIGNFGFQNTRVFTVIFWLGYCNSGINPLLYTFFNRDFRAAFKKILCSR